MTFGSSAPEFKSWNYLFPLVCSWAHWLIFLIFHFFVNIMTKIIPCGLLLRWIAVTHKKYQMSLGFMLYSIHLFLLFLSILQGQRANDPMGWSYKWLWAVMSILWAKLGSYGKVSSDLNRWAISPAQLANQHAQYLTDLHLCVHVCAHTCVCVCVFTFSLWI